MSVEIIGDLDLVIKNIDYKQQTITLIGLSYVPTFWCNLISITTEININKSILSNDGFIMILYNPKTNKIVEFWKLFPSSSGGYLGGMEVIQKKES